MTEILHELMTRLYTYSTLPKRKISESQSRQVNLEGPHKPRNDTVTVFSLQTWKPSTDLAATSLRVQDTFRWTSHGLTGPSDGVLLLWFCFGLTARFGGGRGDMIELTWDLGDMARRAL